MNSLKSITEQQSVFLYCWQFHAAEHYTKSSLLLSHGKGDHANASYVIFWQQILFLIQDALVSAVDCMPACVSDQVIMTFFFPLLLPEKTVTPAHTPNQEVSKFTSPETSIARKPLLSSRSSGEIIKCGSLHLWPHAPSWCGAKTFSLHHATLRYNQKNNQVEHYYNWSFVFHRNVSLNFTESVFSSSTY